MQTYGNSAGGAGFEARVRSLPVPAPLLGSLLAEIDDMAGDLDIAQIALGCALGYLDLRLSDVDWRADYPKLAAWYETFAARPSMRATRPDA